MLLTNPFLFRKTVRLSVAKANFALATQPAQVRRNYRLTANPAALAVSGKSVMLRRALKLAMPARTYSCTPLASRLLVGRRVSGIVRSWAITGLAAVLFKSRVVGFVKTEFFFSGQSVQVRRNLKLSATPATLSLLLKAVSLNKSLGQISALPASVAIAGRSVLLRAARLLTLLNATFTLTGQQGRLLRTYPLRANPADFAIAGRVADLKMSRQLGAVKAAYDFAQPAQTLTYIDNRLISKINYLGLTLGLKLVLDAGDAASLPAASAKWLDVSGNGNDFFRGTTSGSDATDPTINGAPGGMSASEYLSFDGGDYLVYDSSNEAWMNNLHKDGANWWMAGWFKFGSVASPNGVFGTNRNAAGNVGVRLTITGPAAGSRLGINVSNGSGAYALDYNSALTPGAGVWKLVSVGINELAGTGFLGLNDTFETFTANYSSPSTAASTFTLEFGARGNGEAAMTNGSHMAMLAMGEGYAMTTSGLADLFQATRGRFGV